LIYPDFQPGTRGFELEATELTEGVFSFPLRLLCYAGALVDWLRRQGDGVLEIVRRCDTAKNFMVLPRRWVVERTFGWLGRSRRLSRDYERRAEVAEAMVYLTMIRLMLARWIKN